MRIVPWFWTLANFLARQWLRLRLKKQIHVDGTPPSGPVLLCAKHATAFDIPLLADLCRKLRRARPYFQMGSFIGYPVLGAIVPMLRRLGGFSVMRPKEVLRLRHRGGLSKGDALGRMAAVNDEAESTRCELLREKQVLVVFPEGTRDDRAVRPLSSELEIRSALKVRAEGVPVMIWPVVLSFAPKRFIRRGVEIRFLPPFDPEGLQAEEVLGRIAIAYAESWIEPDRLDLSSEAARAKRVSVTDSSHATRT